MTTGVLFDLDGTLWDASESTARAWTEVFQRYGLSKSVSKEDIQSVAGKPYLECLKLVCEEALVIPEFDQFLIDLSSAEQLWMQKIGGDFYSGALDAVARISEKYPVFLVSNCNEWYLDAFLMHSGLKNIFQKSICYGSTGLPKDINIRHVINSFGISRGFYVGDTVGDMNASLAAGVRYIHAGFGFGGSTMPNSIYILNSYLELDGLLSVIANA
jgi:phosphoglycolate phosphatase